MTRRSVGFASRAKVAGHFMVRGPTNDGIEPDLRAYVEAARAAWPGFGVEEAELVQYLADRGDGTKLPPLAHAGDLVLACACARGVPAAIEAFHGRYRTVIARVLSRRRASADLAEDVVQIVLERLLVAAPGQAPKIAEYKGRGSLKSWVSTAAATTLLMMRRATGRRSEQQEEPEFFAEIGRSLDPELLYMKERYKVEIEGAVTRALDGLGDRERALLRLHLGQHMSIDELGAMYKVNRATAARWLATARESLVASARDDLRARLGLSDSERESLAALVQSELHVSIARRLS
jgi:RNA polymerase sigma-70 factor (ECF subfamily)